MRILMVAHSNAPWTPHFARFFIEQGDAVHVVSFSPDTIAGVEVSCVGAATFDRFRNKHLFLTRVAQVRSIIRHFRPDVVFAPYIASNGLTAALSWHGPLVVTAVGTDVLQIRGQRGLRRRLWEELLGFVCRRADLVNTVSTQLTEELVRMGLPAGKIIQLPIGVDTERFKPDPARPRDQVGWLICTRKHEEVYDIPTIIAALKILKSRGRQFHCTFTCGGSLLQEHIATVAAAGLNKWVRFPGQQPYEALPALLREADTYISASRQDGTSLSLLEAMASGLLPVVTNIDANRAWVEQGRTGLLFEPGQALDLAAALGQALEDRELRRRAFEHNRALVVRAGNMVQNMKLLRSHFARVVARRRRSWQ